MNQTELQIHDIDAFKRHIATMERSTFTFGITLASERDGTVVIRSRNSGRTLARLDKDVASFALQK